MGTWSQARAATPFTPGAATFDGTNDYMLRGAGLTGAANSKLLSGSLWFNIAAATDGTTRHILRSVNTNVGVTFPTTNKFNISGKDGAAASNLNVLTTNTYLAGAGWRHVAFNIDMDVGVQIRINGVSDAATPATFVANAIDLTESNWGIGANTTGTSKWNGAFAEFMIWFGVYVDWSDPATLAKVYSGGLAVDPGPAAALVTGTAPIIYQSVRSGDAVTAFATNRGSGGNFTITGSLDLAAGPNG